MTTTIDGAALEPDARRRYLDLVAAEIAHRERILAMKEEAESDLLAFVRMMWRAVEPVAEFQTGWVLEAMCDLLMSVTAGENNRVLLNVPPGSMKSLLLNVFFVAWEWGPKRLAHMRYISVSYSTKLTERDNSRLLQLLRDPTYRECWPHVHVIKEGVGKVENASTGWKIATSIGGTTTGQRGNRVLIDDANDPNEVESKDIRDGTNRWVREVMPDRLNNLEVDAVISIQQRTHEEDCTGTLAKYGTGYVWMMIPMEFDPLRRAPVVLARDDDGEPVDVWHDPRGLDADGYELLGLYFDEKGRQQLRPGSPMAQAEGKLMWAARFSPEAVDEQRQIKGPYAYAGQYQQSPTTRGGAIVNRDWWQTWSTTTFPDFGTVVVALDTALEEKESADYNAMTAWGAFPNGNGDPQLMLRAAWKDRMPLASLVKRVHDECVRVKADYLLIEHKTRGRDVYDEIQRLYVTAPFQTILVPPRGDKVSRLNSVSHMFSGDSRIDPVTKIEVFEHGMIWAPDTEWAEEVINEVANFPKVAHDDLTDTVALALSWIRTRGVVLRKVEHDAMIEEQMRFRPTPGVPYAM